MLPVEQPFKTYTGLDGKPLENGFVYFGEPDLNPVTAPVSVYWDAAGTIPAAQPLRTMGGYVMRAGSPANIFVQGPYSELVLDAKKREVFYARTSKDFSLAALVSKFSDSSGSAQIGFVGARPGAAPRTVQSKLQDFVNAQDYDTLTDAFAASDTVFVTSPNYPIPADCTVPRTKSLTIMAGGSLTISKDCTLTVLGQFAAAPVRVFNGMGTVIGIRQVHPEWWGALGDGTGDDQPAFEKAHNCVHGSAGSVGETPTIWLVSPLYQMAKTFAITPSESLPISVIGVARGKSLLTPTSTFPAGPVMRVDGTSSSNDNQFTLRNFGIIATSNGIGSATAGLQIGSEDPTKKLSGTNPNLIEDLYVSGFPKCYYVVHARMINWLRTAGWNNTVTTANTALYITQKGGFTGDMTFDACQFVGNITNPASTTISIVSTGGTANAFGAYTISGIRFISTIVYQSARQLYCMAGNGSILNDVWFCPGCQFDGGGTNAVYMQSDGSGTILRNVNISGSYFSGSITGDIISLIGGGGRLTDCYFTENFINGSTARSFAVFSVGGQVGGLVFANNRITENNNTTGPAIEINGPVNNFSISGNSANRLTANYFKYFITINSGASQFTVLGNNSGAIGATASINDLSGAVIKAVANNI